MKKKYSNIKLTIALPMYRAKHIGWLGLESLCSQEDIDFEWEIVIAEEVGDTFQEIGINEILKYKERLWDNGCRRIKYIKLDRWIPLSAKYKLMATESDENSKVFCVQQADYFAPLKRLKHTYDAISNGADWVHGRNMPMYNLLNGNVYNREVNPKKFWMALRMDLAKQFPPSGKKRGVDQYLWDSCKSLMGDSFKKHCCNNWGEGIVVHGVNNLSKKFHKFKAVKYNKKLEDIVPNEIAKKIRGLSLVADKWRINIPHFKKNVPLKEIPKYEVSSYD